MLTCGRKCILLNFQYTLLTMLYWSGYAVIFGYVSAYLSGKGLSNTMIGIVTAVVAIASTILQPLTASMIERGKKSALRNTIMVEALIFTVTDILLLAVHAFPLALIILLYAILLIVLQIMTPLLNAVGTISMQLGLAINYGLARGFGSGTYSLTSFLAGKLTGRYGIDVIPVLPGIAFALLLVLLIMNREKLAGLSHASAGAEKATVARTSLMKKYPSFFIVLIGAICLHTAHMNLNTFGFQIVQNKGGGTEELGLAIAIASASEVPMMMLFGLFRKRLKPVMWPFLAGIFYIIRTIGTMLTPGVAGFYVMQALQMFSWALLAVSSVFYVSSVVNPDDEVRGQAAFTTTLTIGSIISSFLGGMLLDTSGFNGMMVFSIIAAVTRYRKNTLIRSQKIRESA